MKLTNQCKQKFYMLYDSPCRQIDAIEDIFVESLIINFFNFLGMWNGEFIIQFQECGGKFTEAVKKTIECCNVKYNILNSKP